MSDNVLTQEMEKTFTQDEVNKIVSDRLSRDRAKNAADLAEREQELSSRELAMTAKEKLAENGLPKDLANILKYSDEKTLDAAIDTIKRITPQMPKGLKVLENKLPEGTNEPGDAASLAIKKAFGLDRKD